MPIAFDFYSAVALIAALGLGLTALLGQRRGAGGGDLSRRAALHFTIPLLITLAVLLPPYSWLPPLAGWSPVYFWQAALIIAVVILVRTVPRLGSPQPRRFYVLAGFYLLVALLTLLLSPLVNLAADLLTLIAFALLGHVFAGFATLAAMSET